MLGQGQASRGGALGPGVATAGSSQPCRCGGLRAAELHGERLRAEGRGSGEAPSAWGPQREVAGSWGRQLERGRRLGLLTHRLTGLGLWPALWSLGFLTCNTGRIR